MKNQFLNQETPEEAIVLDKAWLQVEEQFRGARLKAPAAGFAYRWQARWMQSERRQEQVRKQWVWAANAVAIGLLMVVLTFGALSALGQPFFSGVFSSLVDLLASLFAFMKINLTMLAAIPLGLWLAFAAGCGLLLAAWTVMFRRAVPHQE
jgi:hypothetical protein